MNQLDITTVNTIIEDLQEMRDNGVLTISVSDLIRLMEFKYKRENNIESQKGSENDRAFL